MRIRCSELQIRQGSGVMDTVSTGDGQEAILSGFVSRIWHVYDGVGLGEPCAPLFPA